MFLAKVLLFIQSNFPVLGGTLLHLAVLKKKGKQEAGLFGWLVLIIISLLTGLLMRYITVGYYEWKGLPEKKGVIEAAMFIGGMMGFTGLMWFSSKLQSAWDTAVKIVETKYSKKGRDNSYINDNNYGYRPNETHEIEPDEKER
jgi:hypothetical protein